MRYYAPVTNEPLGVAVRIKRTALPRADEVDDVARQIIAIIRDYANGKSTSLGQTPAQKQVEESRTDLARVKAGMNDPLALLVAEEYLMEDQRAFARERVLGMDHILDAADRCFNRSLKRLKDTASWKDMEKFTELSTSTLQNRIHHDDLRTKRGD
jgi:hypothetical protein